MTERPDHLQPSQTNRGFAVLPPIPGNYGGEVVVWESSAAEEPKLWLKVTELDDLNECYKEDPASPTHHATIHLTAEDAWKLADQLRCAVENHYHGDARPEWARDSEVEALSALWKTSQTPHVTGHRDNCPACDAWRELGGRLG